jgi:hypothetical protein
VSELDALEARALANVLALANAGGLRHSKYARSAMSAISELAALAVTIELERNALKDGLVARTEEP